MFHLKFHLSWASAVLVAYFGGPHWTLNTSTQTAHKSQALLWKLLHLDSEQLSKCSRIFLIL